MMKIDKLDYTEIRDENDNLIWFECLTCGKRHKDEADAELCCMDDDEILGNLDDDDENEDY